MSSRCTGYRCRDFALPYSPEEIEAMRLSVTEWDAAGNEALAHTYPYAVFQDLGTIAAMVQYRGERDEQPRYSCAHLSENGDCAIYERRPSMCARYPYGKRCAYEACTWTDARRVRLPIYAERAS